LVSAIADLHGARLEIETVQPRGFAIALFLPLTQD
jgi:hypothetical protein